MTSLYTEEKNYTLGRGDLYFAQRKADGTLAGERPIGNTPSFKMGATSTSVKHYSAARGMKVQDREVPVQTDYSASFETDDISAPNLAALFLGTAASVAVTSATGVNESFVVEPGLTYQVGIT